MDLIIKRVLKKSPIVDKNRILYILKVTSSNPHDPFRNNQK